MELIYLGSNSKEEIERRIKNLTIVGKLSRNKGTISDLLESNNSFDNNIAFIEKILGYGHHAMSEHDYVGFALQNTTPIIEQTLINHRLASFMVKSRREVDFRNAGNYTPIFRDKNNCILSNNEELQNKYNHHVQGFLYPEYVHFAEQGIKPEDCRFILPYSYGDDFIVLCNVRQAFNIVSNLLYGKESNITECKELGEKLYELFKVYVPYITESIDQEKEKDYYKNHFKFLDELIDSNHYPKLDSVHLTNYTQDADFVILMNILKKRYQFSDEIAREQLVKILDDPNGVEIAKTMMNSLMNSKKQRELEQVAFSFELPCSLATLTHITRHRMQSLLVPDFTPLWNFDYYITPPSIKSLEEDRYHNIYKKNKEMMEYFKSQGVRDEELIYFYLSGQMCNINTTMNARNLKWMTRMRSCDKAQWEVRELVNQMAHKVNDIAPLIGSHLGPYCKTESFCPEGADSCKNRNNVKQKKR